jgi:Protein of unknown function (DUF2934)
MRDIRNEIRERAYHLWFSDGQPPGCADAYWFKAEKEILSAAATRPLDKSVKITGLPKRARQKAA